MHLTTDPIGVFDSGVGGISTLASLTRRLPHEDFWFYGDTRFAPYGTKTAEEVLHRAQAILREMHSHQVKAVVIACNTATSAAAPALRAAESIPIIGMEPALKPAALLRHGGMNLVLATPMTLRLPKYQALAALWGEGAVPLPCPGLMELVEQQDNAAAEAYLRELLAPYPPERIDSVVLGCTHYVFLRPLLQKLLPHTTSILDGNEGTARQLERVLADRGLLSDREEPGKITFHTSGDPKALLPLMSAMLEKAREILPADSC